MSQINCKRAEPLAVTASLNGKRPSLRSGFTLVELLVVISIAVVLAAVLLPTTKTLLQDQKLTEGVRLARSMFETARAQAIATGKPVGLMIDRLDSTTALGRSSGARMRVVVGRPSFTGDSESSRAWVYHSSDPLAILPGQPEVPNAACFNPADNALLYRSAQAISSGNGIPPIKVGDVLLLGNGRKRLRITDIRFCQTGEPPEVAGKPNWSQWVRVLFNPIGIDSPVAMNSYPPVADQAFGDGIDSLYRYRIERSPLQLPATQAVDLPRGISFDLNYSGLGVQGFEFSPAAIDPDPAFVNWQANPPAINDFQSIVVMFAADGSVDRVYWGEAAGGNIGLSARAATAPVHFLIGRADQVRSRPSDFFIRDNRSSANILDPEAVWLTVNPSSGAIFTAPNAAIAPPVSASDLATALRGGIENARRLTFVSSETGLD
jgi:prepilin-type N-terminal cleavage/methylation domain-containing protein